MPSRQLPPPHRLRQLYASGQSLAEIGEQFGVKHRTAVLNTMRKDAERLGLPWPLKQAGADPHNRPAHYRRRDTVLAVGVRQEILDCPHSRPKIGRLAGVGSQTVQEIADGRRVRICRSTASKIMGAISKLETQSC